MSRPPLGAAPLAAAILSLLLAGCASFSPDGGLAPLQQAAQERLGKDLHWARDAGEPAPITARVQALLAQPLSADAAVQIALLNNRGLQASFQQLGIAEAELVQASRLPNPRWSIGRLRRGDEREIERSLGFDLAHLITLPWRRPLEARRFAAVQQQVALTMFSLASDTRKAYYAAVAAQQSQRYLGDVKDAAQAGAELARRMAEAGNWSALQQAREQGFQAEATLNLARAQRVQLASRERLIRLMGLQGAQLAFTLPERLPDLPGAPAPQPDVEQRAMDQRLDVQAVRLHSEATARSLGLTRATRFINVLEFSAQRNTANDAPVQTGYEISLELPLFDWSGARVVQAQALYMQALNQTAQVAVNARSEVREAYQGLLLAHDIARQYRDEVVPNARRISEQNLLRYNGMLIGVFELLADARAQIGSVNAAIEALRDYWLAQADLDMALIGPPNFSPAVPATVAVDSSAAH